MCSSHEAIGIILRIAVHVIVNRIMCALRLTRTSEVGVRYVGKKLTPSGTVVQAYSRLDLYLWQGCQKTKGGRLVLVADRRTLQPVHDENI